MVECVVCVVILPSPMVFGVEDRNASFREFSLRRIELLRCVYIRHMPRDRGQLQNIVALFDRNASFREFSLRDSELLRCVYIRHMPRDRGQLQKYCCAF